VAGAGGANYTLSGSLMKAGPNIVVSMSLQNAATGEVVSPISLECPGEEGILSRVDEVAGRIKSDLNLTSEQIASDIDRKTDEITTRSAEAFKYYSEGRRLHVLEEYQKSIDLMKKAVALDPEFAMAYRSLGSAYGNLKQNAELRANYQKAFDHKDRVSERERYAIEGDYYRINERTYGKAIEAYTKLLELYPDDVIANTNLGVVYSNLEEWDKAIDRYRVLLKRNDAIIIGNLVECYQAKGDLGEAEAILHGYLANVADAPSLRNRLAWVYAGQGRFDQALQENSRAQASDSGDINLAFSRAALLFLKDDLPAAEAEILKLQGSGDPQTAMMAGGELIRLYAYQGRIGKVKEQLELGLGLARKSDDKESEASLLIPYAYLDAKKGNYPEALRRLDRAGQMAREAGNPGLERSVERARGLAFLGAKSIDQAERTASGLKTLCEESVNRKEIRLYLHLRGVLETEAKRYPEAIEHLGQAVALAPSMQPGSWDLDINSALANAYFKSGEKEKALEQYRRFVSNPMSKFGNPYMYVVGFYETGRICRDLGRIDEARANYRKFLDLWKNADPEVPFIRDARAALAALPGG
jgi:tetratricopeptide (TPR) repeat protein